MAVTWLVEVLVFTGYAKWQVLRMGCEANGNNRPREVINTYTLCPNWSNAKMHIRYNTTKQNIISTTLITNYLTKTTQVLTNYTALFQSCKFPTGEHPMTAHRSLIYQSQLQSGNPAHISSCWSILPDIVIVWLVHYLLCTINMPLVKINIMLI